MNIRVRVVPAPAAWASALVNNDFSGLDADDIAALESWKKRELGEQEQVVSTVDDAEAHFTWSFRWFDPRYEGGEVIDYVTHDLEGSHAAG